MNLHVVIPKILILPQLINVYMYVSAGKKFYFLGWCVDFFSPTLSTTVHYDPTSVQFVHH